MKAVITKKINTCFHRLVAFLFGCFVACVRYQSNHFRLLPWRIRPTACGHKLYETSFGGAWYRVATNRVWQLAAMAFKPTPPNNCSHILVLCFSKFLCMEVYWHIPSARLSGNFYKEPAQLDPPAESCLESKNRNRSRSNIENRHCDFILQIAASLHLLKFRLIWMYLHLPNQILETPYLKNAP